MSMLEELYTAIYTTIGSYPSSAPDLEWYGPGVAPDNVADPVLSWNVTTVLEDYAMELGTDHYETFDIQFTASSSSPDPTEAIRIAEATKDLLRSNAIGMSLSTGRILDINVGISLLQEALPGANGWQEVFVLTFEVGT
jgi:hypothetical protein